MVLKVAVCPAILFASLSQYALPLWSYYVLVALVEDFHLGITAAKLEHSNRAMIAVKSFFVRARRQVRILILNFQARKCRAQDLPIYLLDICRLASRLAASSALRIRTRRISKALSCSSLATYPTLIIHRKLTNSHNL